MASNYGCALTQSLLSEDTLRAVSESNSSSTNATCEAILAHCKAKHAATSATSDVLECTLLSSTSMFENPLIQGATSLDEIKRACCTSNPDARCFQPPRGASDCARFVVDKLQTPERSSASAVSKFAPHKESGDACALPSTFDGLSWSDLTPCQQKKLEGLNAQETRKIDAAREAASKQKTQLFADGLAGGAAARVTTEPRGAKPLPSLRGPQGVGPAKGGVERPVTLYAQNWFTSCDREVAAGSEQIHMSCHMSKCEGGSYWVTKEDKAKLERSDCLEWGGHAVRADCGIPVRLDATTRCPPTPASYVPPP